jgi:methyl-accepting chemotaxis protein
MRTTSAHIAETSKTMSNMAETISTVSTFVRGIEDIGAEIELIALNARVKAAHTGDQGRTLGVIAMEIQNLSVDARNRTGKVTGILTRISSVADRLSDMAKTSDVSGIVGGIEGRFETVLGNLASLDADLGRDIDHLSGLSSELVTRINGLTSSIHFHDLVSDQLLDLEKEITGLAARFSPFASDLESARQPEKLREQLSRYTMDSERLVHLSVLGHHEAAHAQSDVDLFGDNDVELFDDNNVELFDDDNVELFDAQPAGQPQAAAAGKPADPEDDLGDNVELF